MNQLTTSDDSRRAPLAYEMLGSIAVVFALMLYGVLRYPASVSQGGLLSFLISAFALLAYAGAALWVQQRSSHSLLLALAQGAKLGMVLGAAAIVNLSLEIFADLGQWRAVLGVSMWGLMFLSFESAGSATYRQTGSLQLSVVSSVWSALVSTVVTLLCGFTISLLFMSHLRQVLKGAYAQSGMTDQQAFVIQNTMSSASSHLVIAPLMAVFFGFASGLACAILSHVRRRTAMALGVSELLVFVMGLSALRFGSFLERPDRPPYVMAGLLALGVSLACAHPVLSAASRSATIE